MNKKYITCGGCGATHPSERCLGCWHEFDPIISKINEEARMHAESYSEKLNEQPIQIYINGSHIWLERIRAYEAGAAHLTERLSKAIELLSRVANNGINDNQTLQDINIYLDQFNMPSAGSEDQC